METIDISQSQEIFTVSQLNRDVRLLLEGSFAYLWVEGEISNFACPNSGHWYFSLKDSGAQVRCVMFRTQNRRVLANPRDGMQVTIKARVSFYEGRGDFQLLAEHMEEAGEGKLRQEFELLKKRLSEAGLFSEAIKKKLPAFPQTIGIITSPTGAAVRDILNILARRFPQANVIIYPSLVQGDLAPINIVAALELANKRKECDVLILARGGGSLEDLWCFNDERVAHAIYKSEIVLISAIGHEVDFTIADFVADLRAPTPSAAAELVAPHCEELLGKINYTEKKILRLLQLHLQGLLQKISWISKHLHQNHPKTKLLEKTQKLDFFEMTLQRLKNKFLADAKTKTEKAHAKLQHSSPQNQILHFKQNLILKLRMLQGEIQNAIQQKQQALGNVSGTLDGLSPLATLNRGFAIAETQDNKLLQNSSQVTPGQEIKVRLKVGKINCSVISSES